jgi:hypothetical protein
MGRATFDAAKKETGANIKSGRVGVELDCIDAKSLMF